MPQVIGPVFSWIGSVATSVFGGGGAAGAAGGAAGAGAASGGIAGGVAGLGGAAAATLGGAAAASAIWGTVSNIALNLAVSSALSVAFKPSIAATSGAPIDFKADPAAPVPFVVGRTGTGGSTVFAEVFGGDQAKFLGFTVVLSLGPIKEYESFKANGETTTFSGGSNGGGNAVGYYNNVMYQDRRLGAQPDTVTAYSLSPWSPTLSGVWTSDHKLSGLATVLWTQKYAQVKYSTGPATPIWVVTGPAVYDPREDSTYPGGSGSQRADDPDTWSFTGNTNPYLQALTWCLGHRTNGNLALGAGLPPAGINMAPFVEGANVADANSWTCGGVVYSSESKWAILEAMLRAGGGKPMVLGSQVHCVVSTPRVSIATLTAEDVDGSVKINGFPGRRERFNTARPRYRDENQDWQFVQGDPVALSSLVTEDGETRTQEIDFGLVQGVTQASQLAAYDILDSREIGPVIIPLRPRWMGLQPGDCITLDDEAFGGSYKLVVMQRERDIQNNRYTLTCIGETDGKHAIALAVTGGGTDPLPPPDEPTGYPPTEFSLSLDSPTSTVTVNWRNPENLDFSYTIVYRNSSDDFVTASDISGPISGATLELKTYDDTPGTGTWFYWVAAYDLSDLLTGNTSSANVTL